MVLERIRFDIFKRVLNFFPRFFVLDLKNASTFRTVGTRFFLIVDLAAHNAAHSISGIGRFH